MHCDLLIVNMRASGCRQIKVLLCEVWYVWYDWTTV